MSLVHTGVYVFKLVPVCSYRCLQGGESLTVQRQQLEELYLAHSGSMSILLEDDDDGLHNHNLGLPQGPANFTLLWYTFLFKVQVFMGPPTDPGPKSYSVSLWVLDLCVNMSVTLVDLPLSDHL